MIPARFASTRLPGKPLVDILGKPMVQHVYERALREQDVRTVLATTHDMLVTAHLMTDQNSDPLRRQIFP